MNIDVDCERVAKIIKSCIRDKTLQYSYHKLIEDFVEYFTEVNPDFDRLKFRRDVLEYQNI